MHAHRDLGSSAGQSQNGLNRPSEDDDLSSESSKPDSFLSQPFRRAGLQKSLEVAFHFSGLLSPVSMSGNNDPNLLATNGGGIPRPRSSLSQTPEEIARAAAAVRPPPSIVVSAKQPSKLKRKIGGFWGRGKGTGSLRKGTFNPEELTSQKRQWAKLQKQGLVSAKHPRGCSRCRTCIPLCNCV